MKIKYSHFLNFFFLIFLNLLVVYYFFRFWVADYNVKTESEELYSTFAYWREPICDTKSSFSFEVSNLFLWLFNIYTNYLTTYFYLQNDCDDRESDGERLQNMIPNKLWYVPMINNCKLHENDLYICVYYLPVLIH